MLLHVLIIAPNNNKILTINARNYIVFLVKIWMEIEQISQSYFLRPLWNSILIAFFEI